MLFVGLGWNDLIQLPCRIKRLKIGLRIEFRLRIVAVDIYSVGIFFSVYCNEFVTPPHGHYCGYGIGGQPA